MSKTTISPALRQEVSKNSRYRCSYCLSQEEVVGMRFTISALRLNRPLLVRARKRWIKPGWHPPSDL